MNATAETGKHRPNLMAYPKRRWTFVALVTAAIAISYFDRQTISVAIAAIQRTIPISNEQFSYLQTGFLLAYAALYAIGGRMLDKLGTRLGFTLIMLWWSLACMLHGFAAALPGCWSCAFCSEWAKEAHFQPRRG